MELAQSDLTDGHTISEGALRGKLVNCAVLVLAAGIYASAQLRMLDIGWHARDYIQAFIVLCALPVVFWRRRILARYQAVFLMAVCVVIGFVGMYSLGLLAAGILLLPIAAVLISLSYSKRTVVAYALLSLMGIGLIALGFTSGRLTMSTPADALLASYAHWAAYILCLGLFYVIGCSTILAHRRAMTDLVAQVTHKSEELEEANARLQEALSEVKTLRGILPTCQHCKKIRLRDEDAMSSRSWIPIETFIRDRTEADFTHGICPDCIREHYGEEVLQRFKAETDCGDPDDEPTPSDRASH